MSLAREGRMRRWSIFIICGLTLSCAAHADGPPGAAAVADGSDCHSTNMIELSTTDGFDSRSVLTRSIEQASRRIDASIYKFNDLAILESVIRALGRGVEVRIVADRKQAGREESLVPRAQAAGAQVRHWKGDQKLHAKFVLVDDAHVLAGSFNWTRKAAENAELVLVESCPGPLLRYSDLFERLWSGAAAD